MRITRKKGNVVCLLLIVVLALCILCGCEQKEGMNIGQDKSDNKVSESNKGYRPVSDKELQTRYDMLIENASLIYYVYPDDNEKKEFKKYSTMNTMKKVDRINDSDNSFTQIKELLKKGDINVIAGGKNGEDEKAYYMEGYEKDIEYEDVKFERIVLFSGDFWLIFTCDNMKEIETILNHTE